MSRQVPVSDLLCVRNLFACRIEQPAESGGDTFCLILAVRVIFPVVVEKGKIALGEFYQSPLVSPNDIADDIAPEYRTVKNAMAKHSR